MLNKKGKSSLTRGPRDNLGTKTNHEKEIQKYPRHFIFHALLRATQLQSVLESVMDG